MIVRFLEGNKACFFYEALGGKRIDTIESEVEKEKRKEIVYSWGNIKRNFK